MTMKLYELAGREDERRFSPYCWRTKLSLAHKDLSAECIPLRFTELDQVEFSGDKRVPVLIDGDKVVRDSWDIALYLEDQYADRPSLFGGDIGRSEARFINHWTDTAFFRAMFPLILLDIFGVIHDMDRAYFRQSREARFGATLEEIGARQETFVPGFQDALAPLRATLSEQPFLSGEAPAYSDYTVFSGFQAARCVSNFCLLEDDDPIYAWRERMLDLYDGLARDVLAYPV